MSKVLIALVLVPAGLLILAGCSKPDAVSTPAERKAFAGTKASPADIAAAMARMNAKPLAPAGVPQSAQPPK